MARAWQIACLAATPVVYLCGEFYLRARDARDLATETREQAIPTVSVIAPVESNPDEEFTLPGNLEAWSQAPIYAQVSGYVKRWEKDYGAEVKKGDVLAEINTPTLDAQTAQARADMEAQRAKYELAVVTAKRYRSVSASHAVAQQAVSVNDAKARAEEARLAAAKHNLRTFEAQQKFKTIVAPYDGVVIARKINVGDYVTHEGNLGEGEGATYLFTVADMHRMRLFVQVPERFGHLLAPGLKADLTVPQFPDRRFEATFLTVAKGFDPKSRTAVTEFVVANEDRALWPGSFASVTLSFKFEGDYLSVPTTALAYKQDGLQVAVVTEESKAHFKDIALARLRDDMVDVASGLSKGDRVINNPSPAILDGDEVTVVTPGPGYILPRESDRDAPTEKPASTGDAASGHPDGGSP